MARNIEQDLNLANNMAAIYKPPESIGGEIRHSSIYNLGHRLLSMVIRRDTAGFLESQAAMEQQTKARVYEEEVEWLRTNPGIRDIRDSILRPAADFSIKEGPITLEMMSLRDLSMRARLIGSPYLPVIIEEIAKFSDQKVAFTLFSTLPNPATAGRYRAREEKYAEPDSIVSLFEQLEIKPGDFKLVAETIPDEEDWQHFVASTHATEHGAVVKFHFLCDRKGPDSALFMSVTPPERQWRSSGFAHREMAARTQLPQIMS